MYLRFTAKKWGDKLGRNWVKCKCANKVNRICTLVLKLFSSNDLLKQTFLNRGNGISFRREDFILCSAHPPLQMFLSVWWKGRDEDPAHRQLLLLEKRGCHRIHLWFSYRDIHDEMLLLLMSSLTVGSTMILNVRSMRMSSRLLRISQLTQSWIYFSFKNVSVPPSPMHPHPNPRK